LKLSVIIVNYNVKYFIEQCLNSVREACKDIDAEVIIIDNNSVDGSVKMLESRFPEVRLIANKENCGFAKATNQGISIAKSEYVLLLNPDTVVENDTFRKCIKFMDEHPDAGGLGVKMLDGKGKFLPESKRGMPTPAVAFYKVFGFSKLFPKSHTFGKYHLTFIDKNKTSEIDILAGAFMFLRKKTLDKTGMLDESFFMYGEDIDISYRITKAGYKNYYFPETRIIHYKGESTRKSSINYVFIFYRAMIIFAKKHFSKKNAAYFTLLINIAIYFRATVAVINRFTKKIFTPSLDTILIFLGMYLLKNYWEYNIISSKEYYPVEFMSIVVPLYIIIWLFSVILFGGYDRPVRKEKIFKGIVAGTLFILVIYALLPESYRFSRALILLGSIWTLFIMSFHRIIINLIKNKRFEINTTTEKKILIIGEKEEAERVADILKQTFITPSFIGFVKPKNSNGNGNNFYLGTLEQIKEIIEIYKIDEVIFCAKDLTSNQIIDVMTIISDSKVDYKIAPPESLFIIGSNSINTTGELYVININSITKIENKRNKRILDVISSLIMLLFIPFLIFVLRNPVKFLKNIFLVLYGCKAWVGYNDSELQTLNQNIYFAKLPLIRKGILNCTDALKNKDIPQETINRLNILYARDYKLANDIVVILKNIRNLGR
jgi:GT2 family glycosyltransferase